MSVRKGVARGVFTLGAGQVMAQALSMAKNIVVARMLGPEQWGVAATFWVALTLLDSVSTMATDRQVVQAEDGGEPRFLGTAHVLQAARGIATGVFVLALSWVAAWAFDAPQALWAYQAIALVPVIRGFSHLGMYVRQREMRFGPTVHVDVWTQAAALAIGAPLAWWLGSFSAALWMILGQTVAACALSHVFAGMRYQWRWDRGMASRMWRFGLPLMANGALMFVIMQGDQAVIGVAYTKETLGLYAAAFGLASIPTMLVAKVASSVFLPPLSRAQAEQRVFERRVGASVEAMGFSAGCVGTGMVLLGPWITGLLYGQSFADAGKVIGLLGVMFAIRLFRTAHSLAAMARGDTVNALVANMFRCVTLPAIIAAAALGTDVWWIALTGVVGECTALVASSVRLHNRGHAPLMLTLRPTFASAVVVGVASATSMSSWVASRPLVATGVCVGLAAILVGLMFAVCPRMRADLGRLLDVVREHKLGSARVGVQNDLS